MREVKRAARFFPTISEGIAQSARADASHTSGRRRKSSCPHHFCPCGVVQPTCLSLMQEITGAKPVRDAILSARGSRGIADPPDSESGSLGRASRLAPTSLRSAELRHGRPFSKPPKHCQRCTRPVREFSPVQLRVGDPILVAVCQHRNRASAQAGFISQLCRGQHSGLRPFFRPASIKVMQRTFNP